MVEKAIFLALIPSSNNKNVGLYPALKLVPLQSEVDVLKEVPVICTILFMGSLSYASLSRAVAKYLNIKVVRQILAVKENSANGTIHSPGMYTLPLSLKFLSSDVSISSLSIMSPVRSEGLSFNIGYTVTSSKILFVRFSI